MSFPLDRGLRLPTALALAVAVLVVCAAAPSASAHAGGSWCAGTLAERGGSYEGSCTVPFQGWPVGVAGVFDSDPADLTEIDTKPAEIHIELIAKLANGVSRPLGVECIETTTGVARCSAEDNPLGTPLTGPEPAPAEIVSLTCSGHSHAAYSRLAPPAGAFACWSTDEARAHLEEDHWFSDNGFSTEPPAEEEPPAPGLLDPLGGSPLTGVVTTVPVNTYAPDTLVVSRTLGLKYVNVDTARHDVVALEAKRPDGSAPWCGDFENTENPAVHDCPLFWTPLIPGGGSETPVLGLEDTAVGESYAFFCSIHPYMTGTIEVVE